MGGASSQEICCVPEPATYCRACLRAVRADRTIVIGVSPTFAMIRVDDPIGSIATTSAGKPPSSIFRCSGLTSPTVAASNPNPAGRGSSTPSPTTNRSPKTLPLRKFMVGDPMKPAKSTPVTWSRLPARMTTTASELCKCCDGVTNSVRCSNHAAQPSASWGRTVKAENRPPHRRPAHLRKSHVPARHGYRGCLRR